MDQNAKCRHQWLIEFAKEPADLNAFADILDKRLQEINSDYEAKAIPRHHPAASRDSEGTSGDSSTTGSAQRGKLGGQHKIPRLSNNRANIDEMLEMNAQ